MKYEAMIIIDMQKALLDEHPFKETEVVSKIKELSTECRKNKIPVIYVRHDGGLGDELEFGTEGWQIYSEIEPQKNETIIEKKFNSAFRDTDLHNHLQSIGAKNIIMCGMQTEYCIDASIKVAFELHYNVTIPKGTTTTFDNEFSPAKDLVEYYEEKIWKNRYAKVVPQKQILDEVGNRF